MRRVTMRFRSILPLILLFVAGEAAAQDNDLPLTPRDYGNRAGVQVLLTNHGFALGGYYTRAVSDAVSLVFDANIGSAKDEREAQFLRYGNTFVMGKANYVLMLPVQGGLMIRLFRHSIEDNFRPYVQLSGGPTIAFQAPYFDDCNGNGNLDEAVDCTGDGELTEREETLGFFQALPRGNFKFGAGATIAMGAFFGEGGRTTQGLRIGYSFNYFADGVQLLERRHQEEPRRFIGTPTITLSIGRLLTSPDAIR